MARNFRRSMASAFELLEPRRLFSAGFIDRTFGDNGTVVLAPAQAGTVQELWQVVQTPHGSLLALVRDNSTHTLWKLTSNGQIDMTFGGGDGNVDVPTADLSSDVVV